MIEREILAVLTEAVAAVFPEAAQDGSVFDIEIPREREHGDYATNAAMTLARRVKRPPKTVAEMLLPGLRGHTELLAEVTIAGPGFLNFRVTPDRLRRGLGEILAAGTRWGESGVGGGRRIQVEYVSANPTGPLNVVSARAAAFGGTLVRLLRVTGHDVRSEFYVNDMGGQIDLLGESLLVRYEEAGGAEGRIPEGGYEGEYLKDLARGLDRAAVDTRLRGRPRDEQARIMSGLAVERIVAGQEHDLAAYGNAFDRWFRQHELYPDAVARALALVREHGHVEEREGAVWFRSTAFGDDQDRVLVRATGEPTYFLADLAYHADKYARGFEGSIDIWGPDHHGYVTRMQAGTEAMGFGRGWLEVIILQQVNLLSGGQPVKMSKRRGEFVTLGDLLADVGRDTAIFFFLMRRAQSHLDFDLDLARKESDENPVYYVKYAHARISGILRKAREEGAPEYHGANLERLVHPAEINLLKTLLQYPSLLAGAARAREPHRLTTYLREVAQVFHFFYHHCRVVGPDGEDTRARLALTEGARLVLAQGLGLLGVEAPERM